METNRYTIKTKTPVKIIAMLALGSIVLLGGIFYAIWYSSVQIADARMSGVITAMEFQPQPEEQIILGKDMLSAREKAGNYVLTVEVKSRDGQVKSYKVWVGKTLYDSVKVGDPFDVGPYLVRE